MAMSGIDRFIAEAELANKQAFTTFSRLASGAGVAVYPALNGECFQVQKSGPQHPDSVEVHGAVRLEQVPYKRTESGDGSTAVKMHILMDSFECFKFRGTPSPKTAFLYSAYARVAYYKLHRGRWKTVLCIRYDFAGAKNAHPIFHAQLENGVPRAATSALFPGLPPIDEMKELHLGIRFPSANVVGATALLKIAADHLPGTSFRAVLKAIQDQKFFQDWRCDCTTLDNPDSAKLLLSSGWYGSKFSPVT